MQHAFIAIYFWYVKVEQIENLFMSTHFGIEVILSLIIVDFSISKEKVNGYNCWRMF